jgi:glyoxylase-like metal-dependent hydrolase (beta-lactamase superfamily II)
MTSHTRDARGIFFCVVAALSLSNACAEPAKNAAPPTHAATTASAQAPAPIIHVVTASPAGLSVNGYLVEGKTGVVAVDSALTVSDSKALRARLDALGKPLLAVLLTHGHPDHYNGVSALVASNGKGSKSEVPIYALNAVARVIHEWDAKKEAQWKPMFGAESRITSSSRVRSSTSMD